MTLDDIFNEQEEKKDTVKPVSSSSLTTNDIFGVEETIKKPVYKPDVERFKEDINRRKENIQQIANREIEGKQGKVSSFLQTTGQVLGVATDFVGEAIVTVGQIGKKILYDPLPEHSKQKFRTEFIEPVKKGIIEPISNKISTGEQKTIQQSLQDRDLPSLVAGQVNKYQEFKEKNPETAYNIEAGLNIVDFIDTFAVAPALIKGAVKKGVKESLEEGLEQTKNKVSKEISKKIKKEALELDYSSKKLTKSFLGSMTSKNVDKYKDDLSRVLAFVTDNDKAVISKSKNATDDFIKVFQKNRTDIGNIADGLAKQVDDVVDVEMFYIGNELEKKFKDRLKSLSIDIKKSGDKVAGKEYAYINDYIKQLKASQNYSASESFDRLKKLNAELSDYYTRKKQPGFTSTKKEKVSIELKAGEADILRNRLYFKMDNALGNNMFTRIRRVQEAFENVNSKVLNKISERNKLSLLGLNEDRIFRGIDAGTKAIRVDQPLTIPGKLINTGKIFLGLEDTKLNDTIKNAFKNLPTKQGVPIKDLVADITDISLKNLDIIKEERYMSDFLQELWKNQDVALLPPPSVIIMPEFSDSAYKAMKEVKLTPPEIVNDNINYQIWVNELNRRPEIKLLTEKATPTSIGTTANPIIPKAPTTYEKPAAKIGNEDFKRIEKFIQDQEALKLFKGNQSKAYDITKDKFNDIKENYPALVETIESHPLRGLENKQSKTGEFAGKLNDKASNLDVLLMERGYNDVEQGREAFEGLKELIYKRQRMEEEMSNLVKDLKEIKSGNKTIIDDIINPKSTEIEDINFGEPAKIGTTDTSIVEAKKEVKRIISEESYQQAKKNLKDKFSTLNSGIRVDAIPDMVTIASYHIENGVKSAVELGKKLASEGYKLTKKQINDLYNNVILKNEANKFKTFDEFKNNQIKVYHGTNDSFNVFNPKKGSQGVIWFTDNIDTIKKGESGAVGIKNIMERNLTGKNFAGWNEYDKYSLGELENMGYDGVKLPNSMNDGSKYNDYILFNNSGIKTDSQLKNIYKETKSQQASSMSSELIEEAKKYDNVEDFIKAQGEPLYHGTPVKFDKFDINKTGTSTDSGMFGKGFYFTSNKNIALGYSKGTGNVKTVYLDMKNPYIIEKSSDIPNIGWEPKTIQEMKNSDKIYSEKFTKYMKDNGYDGVIDKTDNSYDQHIVFDPSQIKTKSQLKDIYNQAHNTLKPKVNTEKALIEEGGIKYLPPENYKTLGEFQKDFDKLNKANRNNQDLLIEKAADLWENRKGFSGKEYNLDLLENDNKINQVKGFNNTFYHGTDAKFKEFSSELGGTQSKTGAAKNHIFLTNKPEVAESYGKNIMPVSVDIKNPLVVNADQMDWKNISFKGKIKNINEIATEAEKDGYDGLIVKNIRDTGGKQKEGVPAGFTSSDTIVVFDKNNIKTK